MRHLLILILTTALCAAQSADTKKARSLMQAAQAKETIGGDLKGAIDLYRQAAKAARADRAVAVEAMLKVAECQERQGLAEARKTYEEIVRDYGDQKVAVDTARRKLGVTASTETRARLLWDNAIDTWGRATADGRYLSFVDWSTGDLAIRDLTTGENRRLTNKGGFEAAAGEVERNSISPDGKRVAFAWDSWNTSAKATQTFYSLRVIDADGKNERVLREFPNKGYVEPLGWSPDSKSVLVISGTSLPHADSQLHLVNLENSEWREIATESRFWKNEAVFSPDGRWIAFSESLALMTPDRTLKMIASAGGGEVEIAPNANLMGWTPDGSGIVFRKKFGETSKLYVQRVANGRAAGAAEELRTQSIGEAGALGITAKGGLIYGSLNRHVEGRIVRLDGDRGLQNTPVAVLPIDIVGFANNLGNLRFSPDGTMIASSPRALSISIRNLGGPTERIISPNWVDLRTFEWAPDGRSFLAMAVGPDKSDGLFRVDTDTSKVSFLCKVEQGRNFVPSPDGKSIFHLSQKGLERITLDTCRVEMVWSRDLSESGPMNIRLSKDGGRLLVQTFWQTGVLDIGSASYREIFTNPKRTGEGATWSGDWSANGERIYLSARTAAGTEGGEVRIYGANGGTSTRQTTSEFVRSMSLSPDGIHAAAAYRKSHRQV